MKLLFTCFLSFFLIGVLSEVHAQLPQNLIGSNPSSLKWQQIKTDKVQIIYPLGLDAAAQRVANIVHFMWDMEEKSIGQKNISIPIVLHGLRVNPNGFVIVGPFRSEFYNIPSQFKDLSPWVDNLAIHEYRHVQQFANADQGLSGLSKDIFGSWIWGGLFAAALPRWYYEGDAVIAETGLTLGGRGRFSEFNMEYHALLQAGIEYDYEKAGAGSLKDYVPGWYRLGYNMLSYGRQSYGDTIWQKVAEDAIRFKGLFYPFARSLKKNTGLTPNDLYEETMDNLKEEWKKVTDSNTIDNSVPVNNTDKSTVTHYNAPIPLEDGKVIALKSGFDRLYELVLLNPDGTEEKLSNIGLLPEQQMSKLSFADKKIVWAELGFSHRWRNESFSELVTYDINTGKKKKLTKKSRYFSPAYSPDGKWISAVKIYNDLSQSIAILDGTSGEIVKELYPVSGIELSYICWLDDNTVAFIETQNQQNQVLTIDVNTSIVQSVTKQSFQHLSHLYVNEGHLYVSMASGFTNNIFRINIKTGNVQKISSSRIGAFQPAVIEDRLYFTEFSHQGYNIKSVSIRDQSSERDVALQHTNEPPFYAATLRAEGGNILDKVPNQEFPTSKFNKLSGLINFHSIIPEWQPPEFSLSVLSDNTFSTLSASVEGRYNYNEGSFRYGAGLRYAEWYPILNASYFKVNREAIFYNFSSPNDSSIVQDIVIDRWDENRATFGLTLPYNFSGGNLNNNVNLFAAYQNTSIRLDDPGDDRILRKDTTVVGTENLNRFSEIFTDPISDQTIHTLDIGVSLNMTRFMARQHLRPTTGFSLLARYRANVGNNILGGNSFLARALVYLPGFTRNHSFSIDAMMVNEEMLSQYRYSDLFIYPRGYDFSLRRDKFLKIGVNYRFPIAYPDWALGGFGFVKRLKGNVFFDYGRFGVTSFPLREQYSNVNSCGFELGLDFRAFRLLEIDLGMRYSYLFNEDFVSGSRHQFDFFVISISE
jgi:hypothetical protein